MPFHWCGNAVDSSEVRRGPPPKLCARHFILTARYVRQRAVVREVTKHAPLCLAIRMLSSLTVTFMERAHSCSRECGGYRMIALHA